MANDNRFKFFFLVGNVLLLMYIYYNLRIRFDAREDADAVAVVGACASAVARLARNEVVSVGAGADLSFDRAGAAGFDGFVVLICAGLLTAATTGLVTGGADLAIVIDLTSLTGAGVAAFVFVIAFLSDFPGAAATVAGAVRFIDFDGARASVGAGLVAIAGALATRMVFFAEPFFGGAFSS